MNLELRDKTVLVTGSTAGIGFAIAKSLAQEGARVWIHGRTRARVDEALASLRAEIPDARAEGVTGDLARPADVDEICRQLPDVDILVNNAGFFEPKPFEEIGQEDWERMLQVNVLSQAQLAKHHLPRMLAKNSGRIVFISSESGVQIPVEMIHYGVSKTAQVALSRGLAERTRGTQVTVNSVLAGPTSSEGVTRFVSDLATAGKKTTAEVEAEFFETVRPSSLIQRFAQPDEVARVVTFLVSPAAAIINGAAIRAEGGLLKGAF